MYEHCTRAYEGDCLCALCCVLPFLILTFYNMSFSPLRETQRPEEFVTNIEKVYLQRVGMCGYMGVEC